MVLEIVCSKLLFIVSFFINIIIIKEETIAPGLLPILVDFVYTVHIFYILEIN